MLTKLRLLFSITILFLSFYASAQGDYWERTALRNSVAKQAVQRLGVANGMAFSLKEDAFRQSLTAISSVGQQSGIVHFPDSEGKVTAYRVVESPVLSPTLSEKYPSIKSYSGRSIENPSDRIRFSVSGKDVQAMVLHMDGKDNEFIQKVSDDRYLMFSRDAGNSEKADFICRTKDKLAAKSSNLSARPVDGQVLRKYRLAISATAEYTEYHGGTVADALAAINATLTRINGVFETDLAVTLELIATNEQVIFTDPATDPYTGSLAALSDQAQNTLTDVIGEANYDIGHVFHEGLDGGNAGFIGAICNDNQKGSAYASSQNPEGPVFDLDFAAHEMGHQLGANHTWSFESEGTLVQVEPGSGSTIMGYAGITQNDDVQPNGDAYFHYISIQQIIDNLSTKSCGEVVGITNAPPLIDTLSDYVIPKATAFVLTGNATDSDVDDVLTYTWEQIDNGVVTRATFGPTNPSGANFRSRPPTTEAFRYFPSLSRIVEDSLFQNSPTVGSAWETISSVERDLDFAFTVRDNAAEGGQVVSEFTEVSVTNSAGPFVVTSQASAESYTAGEAITVTWDVAGTNEAPVNTENVDILLSTDGGQTFPIVLAEGIRNDGSHDVVVPGIPTAQARIMIKAVGNIFLAVNASDFNIEASEIVLDFAELEYGVCQSQDLSVPFTYQTSLDFDEEVTFSVADLPAGLTASFSPETATTGNTSVNLLFENTENVAEGDYELLINATSASITKQIPLQLAVFDTDFPDVTLTAPADGLADASTRETLTWEADTSYTEYEIQIATDVAFTDTVDSATVFLNEYTPSGLEDETTYFWRVKPLNDCGEGNFSAPFSFTTIAVSCENKTTSELPLEISAVGEPSVISKIAFFEDLSVADINVNLNIEHSFLADLTVSLTSPSNTTVILFSNSCGDLNNTNATFDDDAPGFVCGNGTAISGTVKPLGSLASFEGESILGEWILEVKDNAASDGGSLNGFSLDICVEGEFRPDADNDGVFDDGDDLCLDTPAGAEVDTTGCPIFRFPNDNFTVQVESETCRNNDDGKITIEAGLVLDIIYDITVTGNGTSITDTFVNTFTAEGLEAGTYTVCIGGSTANIDYEQYCFEVTVSQPDSLGVSSQIVADGTEVELNMTGAEVYTVTLNGKMQRTEKSRITLDLGYGTNFVEISTDQSCQGTYKQRFVVSGGPAVFPNPFTNSTQLFLGAVETELNIAIFSADGQLVKEEIYAPNSNKVDLDFTGFPPGMYMVKFEGKNSSGTTKVIKR